MSVEVYGCNHVAIDVGDVDAAVAFYVDVFGLEKLDEGEGDAFSNWASISSWPCSKIKERIVNKAMSTLASWFATRRNLPKSETNS